MDVTFMHAFKLNDNTPIFTFMSRSSEKNDEVVRDVIRIILVSKSARKMSLSKDFVKYFPGEKNNSSRFVAITGH